MNHQIDVSTKAGTVGGTMLSILATISSGDLIKTAVLAVVGAVVSFGVTLLLKLMIKRRKK